MYNSAYVSVVYTDKVFILIIVSLRTNKTLQDYMISHEVNQSWHSWR